MPRRRLTRAPDARAVAHEVLVRVETTDAFADVLLADRLVTSRLAERDRALASRLVYGTLAWQGRLDHHLAGLVRTPLPRLEPRVRVALRLGLHQLLFLDRVPTYAAVDSSAGLVRPSGRGATGLVNAVLRRAAAAGRAGLPLPDAADPTVHLAATWSHPTWLVDRWAREIGIEELPALLAANNSRGPTVLRANPTRTSRDDLLGELTRAGVQAEPSRWAPDGIVVRRGTARLRGLTAWSEGRFAFQGEASQLVAPLLTPPPDARLLDVCAAPGGKATHAATLLGPRGRVLAVDRRAEGIRRAVAEATRLGSTGVDALVADATALPVHAAFDGVLLDAPCSGLGTLRRHPEVRWRRRPEDVPRLALLQRAMLRAVAPLVRPGGTLVYAVCTLTHEETDGVIDAFLGEHPRFRIEPPREQLPDAIRTSAGCLRTLPHRHGLDGFFAARLLLDSHAGVR